MSLLDERCVRRVTAGATVGAAVGGAVGAVYGTYDAFRAKVPGLLKVRYIGRTTLRAGAAAPGPASLLLHRVATALNGSALGADGGHADLGPVPPLLAAPEDAAAAAASRRGLSLAGEHPVFARARQQQGLVTWREPPRVCLAVLPPPGQAPRVDTGALLAALRLAGWTLRFVRYVPPAPGDASALAVAGVRRALDDSVGAVLMGLPRADEDLHELLAQARADGRCIVLQLPHAGAWAGPACATSQNDAPDKRLRARPAGLRALCPPGADGWRTVRLVLWAGADGGGERAALTAAVIPILAARAASRRLRFEVHDLHAELPAGAAAAPALLRAAHATRRAAIHVICFPDAHVPFPGADAAMAAALARLRAEAAAEARAAGVVLSEDELATAFDWLQGAPNDLSREEYYLGQLLGFGEPPMHHRGDPSLSRAADAAPRDEEVDGDHSYLDLGGGGDGWALPPRGADGLHVLVFRRARPAQPPPRSYEAVDDGTAAVSALGGARLAESASLLYAHPDVTLRSYDCTFGTTTPRLVVGLEAHFVPMVVDEVWARLDCEFPPGADGGTTTSAELALGTPAYQHASSVDDDDVAREAASLLAPCAGGAYALRGEDRQLLTSLRLGAPRLLLLEHAPGGGGSCALARCAAAALRDDPQLSLAAALAGACGRRPRPAAILRRLCTAAAAAAGLRDAAGGWTPPATTAALQAALRGLCGALVAASPGGARRVALLLDAAADVDDPRGLDWALAPVHAALPDWVQLVVSLPDPPQPVPPPQVAPLVAAAHAAAAAALAAAVPGATPGGALTAAAARALWAEAAPDAAAAPEDFSASAAARRAAWRARAHAAHAAAGDAAAMTLRLPGLAPAQRLAVVGDFTSARFADLPPAAIEAIADKGDGSSPYFLRLSAEALLRCAALGGPTSGVVEAAQALPATLRGALDAALAHAEAHAARHGGCPAAATAAVLLAIALAKQPLRFDDLEAIAADVAPELARDALPSAVAGVVLAAAVLLRRTELGPSAGFEPRCGAAATAICDRYAPRPGARAAAYGALARRFAPAALDGAGGTHAARHGVYYAIRAGSWGAVLRALAPDDAASVPYLESRLSLGDAGELLEEYDAILEAGEGAARLVVDALAGPAHDGAGGLRSRSPSPLPGRGAAMARLPPARSPSPEARGRGGADDDAYGRALSPPPRPGAGGVARPCSPEADAEQEARESRVSTSAGGVRGRASSRKILVADAFANATELALSAVADAAAASAAATAAVTRRSHAAAFAACLRSMPRRVASRRVASLRSARALLRAHAEALHARPWLLLQLAAAAPARTPVAHAAAAELLRRAAEAASYDIHTHRHDAAHHHDPSPQAAPPGAKQLLLPRRPPAAPAPAVTLAAPRGAPCCVAPSPCGDRIAVAADGGGIMLCHARTGEALATLPAHAAGCHAVRLAWCAGTSSGAAAAAAANALPPSADVLAAACSDGTIVFVRVPRVPPEAAADAAMPLCGALVDGRCVKVARGSHPGGASCAASGGDLLVTGGADGTVLLWDPAAAFGEAAIGPPTPLGGGIGTGVGPLCALAAAPDGRAFAAAGWAGGAVAWRLAGGAAAPLRAAASRPPQLLYRLAGHGGRVTALSFSPTTPVLATASADGAAALWCARSGRPLSWLKGVPLTPFGGGARPLPPLTALAFSPDGRLLATADAAGTVCVWPATVRAGVRQGRGGDAPPSAPSTLHEIRGLPSAVADVAFAAGGTRLALALRAGGVHLWARAGLRGGELDGGPGAPYLPPPVTWLQRPGAPPPPPPSLLPPPPPALTEWEVADARGAADDTSHAACVVALASQPAPGGSLRGDGDVALSIAADGDALLWRRGAPREALPPPARAHGMPPTTWRCGALAPGARWALAAGDAGAAAVWRLPRRAPGIPLHDAPLVPVPATAFVVTPRGAGAVLAAAFCDDRDASHADADADADAGDAPALAATGGADGAVRLYRFCGVGNGIGVDAAATLRDESGAFCGRVCALAWGPRAAGATDALAAAGDDRCVTLWSASIGAAAARLGGDDIVPARLQALCWSDAAAVLASGCAGGHVTLWDVRSPGNAAQVARLPRRTAAPWHDPSPFDAYLFGEAADQGVAALAFCPVQPCWLAAARRGGGADVYDTRMLAAPAPLPLRRLAPPEEAAAAESAEVAHAPAAALAAVTAVTWHRHDGSPRTLELWLGDAAGRVRRLAVTPYNGA